MNRLLHYLYLTCGIILPSVAAKKTNVIIIMTDDQGYGDLGCHGNPILKTPNLDQLYSESVRFTDFQTDRLSHVDPLPSQRVGSVLA